ncbi:exosortase-associated EpsI family protein [Geobacter sp.]|uniref:exosortase-associated EpsI family protein n=1 Tax=Geobacter sp. TaxID=46610 RepID=UPI003459BBE6
MVLNGKVVTNHFERKFNQILNSFFGARAGGTLVRVSSINAPQGGAREFEVQKEFVTALYGAVNGEQRTLLFGDQALAASR